jgi:hypothetical protein
MPLSPTNPRRPPARTPQARVADRLAGLEKHANSISSYLSGGATQQIPVVDALGPAGRLGRLIILRTDKKVYRDNGSSWVAVG